MLDLPDLSKPLAPGAAALVPAVAALLGALVGGLASVAAVIFTHWLTARREIANDRRSTRALLAVLRGEADALARLAVARRNTVAALKTAAVLPSGNEVALLTVSPLEVASEGAASLGLLPVDAVTELFAMNATVREINRVLEGWSKFGDRVLVSDDLDAIHALFVQLLAEANSLAGLAGYELRSVLGRVGVFLRNVPRLFRKEGSHADTESGGDCAVDRKDAVKELPLVASKSVSHADSEFPS